jgi:ubiquinone/menaquinone biosynthesis C-methylase UbiE
MSHRQPNLADQTYVKDQYCTSNNLEARATLHERFGTAKQKWFHWYWDHLDSPADARILELGCGVGMLWRDNRARIPMTWRLTLSDFSFGMIETTRAAHVSAHFLQGDAQAIPFRDHYFDAVIANHMLYHVPDVARAIAEMRRVLKPGGKFYAATNGDTHLHEMIDLVTDFLHIEHYEHNQQFTLENGEAQINQHFSGIKRFDFQDALVVTEVEPLVAYIMSGFTVKLIVQKKQENDLRQFVAERMQRDNAFRITKSTGLFIATG